MSLPVVPIVSSVASNLTHQEVEQKLEDQDLEIGSSDSNSNHGEIETEVKGGPLGPVRSEASIMLETNLDSLLREIEGHLSQQTEQQTCCSLLFITFTLFFPDTIKRHVQPAIQIIVGILIMVSLLVLFIWLYFFFGIPTEYVIETSIIPDNAINCSTTFLEKQQVLEIDIYGRWSTEPDYDAQKGGPWKIWFNGYQASEETFKDNIEQLTQTAKQFQDSLNGMLFVDILGKVFFYQQKLEGYVGNLLLHSKIDLEVVFDNYVIPRFTLVNLKHEINNGRVPVDVSLPPIHDADCMGEVRKNEDFFMGLISQWECSTGEAYGKVPVQRRNTLITTPTFNYSLIFGEKFFPNQSWYEDEFQKYLDRKSDQDKLQASEVVAHLGKEFVLEFDFVQVFVYNYCNGQGKELCYNVLNDYMLKTQGENWQDQALAEIGGFWGELSSQVVQLNNQAYIDGVVKREVFISELNMFGLHVRQIPVFVNDTDDFPLNQQFIFSGSKYVIFDLIVIPQILSYQIDDNSEEAANKCAVCSNDAASLEDNNCEKTIDILLHLYSIPVNKDNNDVNYTLSLDVCYITTFLYVLRSTKFGEENMQSSFFQEEFNEFSNTFFYSKDFATVDNLNCNASEWTFQVDGSQINSPFRLTTGIYTCMVRDAPGFLQRIGDSTATVEFIHLGIVIFIIVAFVLVLLPQARARSENKRKLMISQLADAIQGVQGEIVG
eukprot:TRINITY_DN1583_c0_g1_i11.p1 TRINITY_DN1583_c0_g1~~TRINITY_DN1583_c0_g1_i11.p1  ORF type:complete len:717 (+),score=46.38 TRINITY_DN1583_c0_g1_i11:111-2261(+)